jgi:hypothetical protein
MNVGARWTNECPRLGEILDARRWFDYSRPASEGGDRLRHEPAVYGDSASLVASVVTAGSRRGAVPICRPIERGNWASRGDCSDPEIAFVIDALRA